MRFLNLKKQLGGFLNYSWYFHCVKKVPFFTSIALVSCGGSGVPAVSDVNINNGKHSDYPEVPRIMSPQISCTGTWVAPNKILTAAHCTKDKFFTHIMLNSRPISPVSIKNHPKFEKTKDGYIKLSKTKYDLSILTFKQNLAPKIARICPSVPKQGDRISIVGYGLTSHFLADLWHKVLIYPQREDTPRHIIRTKSAISLYGYNSSPSFSGRYASGHNGDSGGPLFVGQGPEKCILGVLSTGRVGYKFVQSAAKSGKVGYKKVKDKNSSISHYVDLTRDETREFLRSNGLEIE